LPFDNLDSAIFFHRAPNSYNIIFFRGPNGTGDHINSCQIQIEASNMDSYINVLDIGHSFRPT
jgi:hypothetical protein